MTSPASDSLGIPEHRRRRVSQAALHDLEEPRPPGGWNTLERFATSYSRSATFFRLDHAGSPASSLGYHAVEPRPGIPHFGDDIDDTAVTDEDEETGLLGSRRGTRSIQSQESLRISAIGEGEDHFAQFRGTASPKPGDFYGTIRRGSRRLSLLSEHAGGSELLIKEVSDEQGNIIEVVVGQSTVQQTIFNSVNILVGIGLLSLPLAFKYSGWLLGGVILSLSGLVTLYTARILARCMEVDPSLITYADIGWLAFGQRHQIIVSMLFSLELTATCVALVVLFADSLHALFPHVSATMWKLASFLIFIPLSFVPLNVLSYTSILGILGTIGLVFVTIADGFIKHSAPGSLIKPMSTSLFPEHWGSFPLSIGLFMAPWGGHSIYPQVYRDMRHPYKFSQALGISYSITFAIDTTMGIVGYLMFGRQVLEEITQSILGTSGYPLVLNSIVVSAIAIIPITKMPLNTRPISTTLDILLGLAPTAIPPSGSTSPPIRRGIYRALIRIFAVAVPVVIAIVFPDFDRIMAFLGSAMCIVICIILPICYYFKILGHEISARERILCWMLLIVATLCALVGTIWTLLPAKVLES